jgi:hypothetical protein
MGVEAGLTEAAFGVVGAKFASIKNTINEE